jgi:methylated-DNA-[protein]-cysteine S-methyltransferase
MTGHGYCLFDTAIGRCGLAWGPRGLAAVQLPEASEAKARERLARRCPQASETSPPPEVARVIDDITALLAGEARDLSAAPLDLDAVPAFHRRVYQLARTIPLGATLTYGEIAARVSEPGAARAVGQAMGQNPWPIVVPCHRVLAAGGRLGGFSAPGGRETKRRLLAIEGARSNGGADLFDR